MSDATFEGEIEVVEETPVVDPQQIGTEQVFDPVDGAHGLHQQTELERALEVGDGLVGPSHPHGEHRAEIPHLGLFGVGRDEAVERVRARPLGQGRTHEAGHETGLGKQSRAGGVESTDPEPGTGQEQHHQERPDHGDQGDAGRNQRSRHGRKLHHPAARFPTHCVRSNHPQARDLRDREVDEDDAAAEDLRAERYVSAEHQQARNECGNDDAQLELAHSRYSSSVAMVCS